MNQTDGADGVCSYPSAAREPVVLARCARRGFLWPRCGATAALLLATALAIVLYPSRSRTNKESAPDRDRQEPHL